MVNVLVLSNIFTKIQVVCSTVTITENIFWHN